MCVGAWLWYYSLHFYKYLNIFKTKILKCFVMKDASMLFQTILGYLLKQFLCCFLSSVKFPNYQSGFGVERWPVEAYFAISRSIASN